jgi:uncharacterized protein
MPRVLIAGGNGLVGNALQKLLRSEGYDAMVLSRDATNVSKGIYHWEPSKNIVDAEPFHQADYIVNLAGENIGEKRLTKSRKQKILNSRIHATKSIGKMLQGNHNVKAIVQASAFGYYGNGFGKLLTENTPAGNDFLSKVCVEWESAANELRNVVQRVVIFRFAHVLSNDGGLLPRLMMPMKFGVMPVFGNGQQHIPWIHIDDLCRMILFALRNENINGTYNAVSPSRSMLLELLQATADAIKRKPIKIHFPETVIRLGVGEIAESFYYDVQLSSEKIEKERFEFMHPQLEPAVESLIV